MTQIETSADDESFGAFAFHAGLPGAIRSLDNEELRALLVALLTEWRARTLPPDSD
jgi:hypothetical protein